MSFVITEKTENTIRKSLKTLNSFFFKTFFPSTCPSCSQRIIGNQIICDSCMSTLELLHPAPNGATRCATCFQEIEHSSKKCVHCLNTSFPFDYYATCFERKGAIVSLLKEYKELSRPYLAKVMASYLLLQLDLLQWNSIDCIVPVPESTYRRLASGYSPNKLIANELSRFLQCPVYNILKRKAHPRQTKVDWSERKKFSLDSFLVTAPASIYEKNVLIIDDYAVTKQTIQAAAYSLSEHFPKNIYALTIADQFLNS